MRPVFHWQGRTPNDSSMELVQESAWLFAVVAFVVAGIRVLVEYAAVLVDVDELERRATAFDAGPPGLWDRAHPVLRVLIGAVAATFFLAGFVLTWEEAALLFVGLLVIIAVRTLAAPLVPRWPQTMGRIPVLVRLVASIAITAIIVLLGLSGRMRGESFVPLMAGFFVALLLFAVFFPAGKPLAPVAESKGGSA